MMQAAEQLRFSAEDYLAWEETQAGKHEFVAGEVFAVPDVNRDHVVVTGNIMVALKLRLRGTPYRTYLSQMMLRVKATDAFFYPDGMVSCHPDDLKNQRYIANPSLVVEVLSDATVDYDRGGKFVAYRTLESLKEYLIVDIAARRVECFRRTEGNDWLLHEYVGEVDCELTSLNIALPMADIFEDIDER